MLVYNKLVRDKIPEIIERSGKKAEAIILDEKQYYTELVRKLEEEVKEFTESDSNEELSDILEVLDSIFKAKGITLEEIRTIQAEKRYERGGFEKRIFLKNVED